MTHASITRHPPTTPTTAQQVARLLADQAFSRSAGAPLVGGNAVRLLCDATANYPAWEHAIAEGRADIRLEMYIVNNDRTGRRFVDLLAERARAGVRVRVLYDWLGSGYAAATGLFRPLVVAGGEVRSCNRPSLWAPLDVLSRDHRKLLVVDDEVAFVSGLCIGDAWPGDPSRGKAPWRDTGIEIRGPAVADAQAAFAQAWSENGPPDGPVPHVRPAIAARGTVSLRVIATTPATAKLYRMDLLVAALARETLWLTDAYFMGTPIYREGLCTAARDGVDVRLLVPRSSDVRWLATVSRTLYRPLLEAGVRVFEWDGPMIHAKTAVTDGRWARIGSSNLNLASLLGNWELDVAIEDRSVAEDFESQFLDDLHHATEVTLGRRRRVVLAHPRRKLPLSRERAAGSARSAARYAASLGSAVEAAVRGHRPLDATEAGALATVGLVLLALAAVCWFYPRVLAAPAAALLTWLSLGALFKGWRLKRRPPQSDSAEAG